MNSANSETLNTLQRNKDVRSVAYWHACVVIVKFEDKMSVRQILGWTLHWSITDDVLCFSYLQTLLIMNPEGVRLAPLSIFLTGCQILTAFVIILIKTTFPWKSNFKHLCVNTSTAVDFSLPYLYNDDNKKQSIINWYPKCKCYGNILHKKMNEWCGGYKIWVVQDSHFLSILPILILWLLVKFCYTILYGKWWNIGGQ